MFYFWESVFLSSSVRPTGTLKKEAGKVFIYLVIKLIKSLSAFNAMLSAGL